jgi:hypothetical protein
MALILRTFQLPISWCFLGRHHADEATKAQPGRERVGAGKRRTQQNQETVEKAYFLRAFEALGVTEAAQSAFSSSNSTTLVWPVMGTMTPGDFTIILLPVTRMRYTRSVSKIA